jgi:hypothetical protein
MVKLLVENMIEVFRDRLAPELSVHGFQLERQMPVLCKITVTRNLHACEDDVASDQSTNPEQSVRKLCTCALVLARPRKVTTPMNVQCAYSRWSRFERAASGFMQVLGTVRIRFP